MDLGGWGQRGEESSSVDYALDQLTTGLDHLIKVVDDGGLDHLDDHRLVEFIQVFERTRNRLALVDHRVIADADRRDLANRLAQSSTVRMLTSVLRLSPGAASRRVKGAEAVGDRTSMLGAPLAARRPVLAAAQRAGMVSPEQVHVIVSALEPVDRQGFDPAEIAVGEALLTRHAETFNPKELSLLARQVVDAINPDGSRPDDRINADRRHLRLRPTRDGAWTGEFRLTGALGAKLSSVLGPLAKPRSDRIPDPDDPDQTRTNLMNSDDRTYGQRLHDALEEVCDRVLQSGRLPDSGGTPASVIVTISLDNLLDQLGYGVTSDGTVLSTAEVLRLADQAEIIPTVLNRAGAVLDLGRNRRIATASQTMALVARDGGCSFPGCDHPPEWCERHHVVAWIDGGLTNLGNLTLLCGYHHRYFAERGWIVRFDPDQLPVWVPPRWIDPMQRPMINNRIRLAHLLRQ